MKGKTSYAQTIGFLVIPAEHGMEGVDKAIQEKPNLGYYDTWHGRQGGSLHAAIKP